MSDLARELVYARQVLRSSEDANARELAARLIAIFAPRGDAS